jgi:hypothetical protein
LLGAPILTPKVLGLPMPAFVPPPKGLAFVDVLDPPMEKGDDVFPDG